MKQFKLLLHNKNFSEESFLINSKDYPSLIIGDIVEICSSDAVYSPLLLQVTSFTSDSLQKGYISIDQAIANIFQLKNYADVTVKVIDNLEDVSLDSVELTFKDQYLARSDMWTLKKCLVNTCMYPNKKLEFYGIRCQVLEMYTQGEKVASGIVTEETKIVYRSASSMVYLFIQMSCEMWDFDINGDLYFEKAIDGFLPDLFTKWKKLNCNHDVTIVLFSRTFYEAQSIDEFPCYMRECLQKDYKGRFFEDFYRVAVQNERYDEWSSTIILLKKLFNQYQNMVLKYHRKYGSNVPKAVNSTSSQGNFLEVLNMSLNVFEKHYMDRSFDRTGQLSVVITPGVGYFEVDRELTIITKQRIIDNGIGSDLVCLGEQPLHAVPLFKFYNKQGPRKAPTVVDDYNMPHWINLRFYSSPNQTIYSDFVPRIKLPTLSAKEWEEKEKGFPHSTRSRHASQPDPSFPVLFDYDEYDRQVFKVPAHSQTMRQTLSLQRPCKRKDTAPCTSSLKINRTTEDVCKLTSSDPAPIPPYSYHSHASSDAIAIPHSGSHVVGNAVATSYQSSTETDHVPQRQYSRDETNSELTPPCRAIVGSDPSYESELSRQLYTRRLKALVNPFNPSQITIKLTSNRRRWTHVFPLGVENRNIFGNINLSTAELKSPTSGGRISVTQQNDNNLSWMWGGEQEWTPALTTGVDWKSLVIPACLPITTDYFPDMRSLHNDYVLSDYSLHPDAISEVPRPRYFQNDDEIMRRSLTTPEVYKELICQRLQQGFQIILISKQHSSYPHTQVSSSPQFMPAIFKSQQSVVEPLEECLLSIGRIFHKLNLDGPKITVTQYRPHHPYREIKVRYCYRFHAPDSDTYGVSWVNFSSEKLENYIWNYLDHSICTRGEGEFELKDSLKYWRLRMLLLPAAPPETRKIIDGSEHCDLYNEFSIEEKAQQRDGILKFIEMMNKIRRSSNRKPKLSVLPPRRSSIGTAGLVLSTASYRDRVSSNRIHDRPRMRSVSARMGARPEPIIVTGRISPATEIDGRFSIAKLENAPNSADPLLSEHTEDNFPGDVKRLDEHSTDEEIIQAMQNTQDGLNFLSKAGWPKCTFISAEAVFWLTEHVTGILVEQQAVSILVKFVEKGLICHASGSKNHPFIHGFYLYYIIPVDGKDIPKSYERDDLLPEEAINFFEREWIEVELSPSLPTTPLTQHYSYIEDDTWNQQQSLDSIEFMFKCTNLQIDQGTKSGRQEWGQLRYQNTYRAYEAFELVVEWMVASGNKAAELVQSWARKSNQYGLQLVPIPSDPFALPFSDDSDPLRGPIFIPLDLSCLFDTFVHNLDEDGLLRIQERILCKFGFILYRNPNPSSPPQYVHLSGSMFVMLPVHQKESNKRHNGKHLTPMDLHQISSPHDEYITRHFSGVKKNKCFSSMNPEDTKIGFLWSWNYMITKRWKNTGTVDENFMRKVMRDFRAFCANHNERLEAFWKASIIEECGLDQSLVTDLELSNLQWPL